MRLGVACQLLLLERRVAKVGSDLGAALDDGGCRLGVGNGNLQLVELVELRLAPQLGRRLLQDARLHRHAHGRQRNAVFVAEIGNGFDGRVVAHQQIGKVAQRCHAFDVLLALGTVPQREQRAHAGTGNVDLAGQQRIVDHRAAGELQKLHLDIHAPALAVLFDQLLLLRHVQQQVDDAELLGNAQLAFLGMGAGRGHGCGQHGGGGQRAAQAAQCRTGWDAAQRRRLKSFFHGKSPGSDCGSAVKKESIKPPALRTSAQTAIK